MAPLYLSENRPSPEKFLRDIQQEEKQNMSRGNLKIFFGYAAGVGKTYAMLSSAQEQIHNDVDVVVGYIEPHSRPETTELIEGLPIIPPLTIMYKTTELKEFDLDAVLKRKPDLVLVDEFAHTNAMGVRNRKRFQDVEELLTAGIDVYTTLNVQHLESLNDIIENITKVKVRETIPDYVFDDADKVKLIDIEPDELLSRFQDGKIYSPEKVAQATNNFFSLDNLRLLREVALRKATERIEHENQNEPALFPKLARARLLTCISPSPSSAKCLRWTARASEAFHTGWVAVYVDDPANEKLTPEQAKTLQTHMNLAEKLGAEVITLTGHDIAFTVTEYAKLAGISNIVIGKSRTKRTLFSLFDKDLEDQIIALLPRVEVHVLPNNVTNGYQKPFNFPLPQAIKFSWFEFLKVIGILTIATALSYGLHLMKLGNQNVIMLYILSVIFCSMLTSGYFYGMLASVLSVLTFNFFFTEPYFTFNAIQPDYPITFTIMFLVALIASSLMNRTQHQVHRAVDRERQTHLLQELSSQLLTARGSENVIRLTTQYLADLFKRSVSFYTITQEQELKVHFQQAPKDLAVEKITTDSHETVARWVLLNHKVAGAGTDTFQGVNVFYLPINSYGNTLAVIGVCCDQGELSHEQQLFLRLAASQIAMAIDRQNLSDEQRKILIESEKEQMRSNLLRAISHDLRTPLTGILGASTTLLDNSDRISTSTRHSLLTNIKEDSQWLIRMVENLLSVTRINSETMNVSKTSEPVEEIAADAVQRILHRFSGLQISVTVPEELLMVPMDGTLIVQVLMNLIENAIRHSNHNTSIEVRITQAPKNALFEVIDDGKGIPEKDFPYLFEGYIGAENHSADSSRNLGIGLSICKSIISAHQGEIGAKNRKAGGAVFWFTLPLV